MFVRRNSPGFFLPTLRGTLPPMSTRGSSPSPPGARTVADPMAPTIASVPPPKSIDATIAAMPNVVLGPVTLNEATSHDPFTLASGEISAGAVEVGKTEIGALAAQTRYESGPLLGTGGMGEVRLCGDARIGRRVAKKRCIPKRTRLRRERDFFAKLACRDNSNTPRSCRFTTWISIPKAARTSQ